MVSLVIGASLACLYCSNPYQEIVHDIMFARHGDTACFPKSMIL